MNQAKSYFALVGLIFSSTILLYGQKEGDQWVIGYWSNGNPEYSVMFLDFRSGELEIAWHDEIRFQMNATQGNICMPDGIPLLWTNGMQIMGGNGVMIEDTIAYFANPVYWDYYFLNNGLGLGFLDHDAAIILPRPTSQNEYSVIYHSSRDHPDGYFQVDRFLEAVVRYNTDSTFTLLYRDSLIHEVHKWYNGTISAVRHANGRDWWLVTFEAFSPVYYSMLMDPDGLKLHHSGSVDSLVKEGLGQTVFSPYGNYLARMDAITYEEGQYITLYTFDRCTGDLERIETLRTDAGAFTGVAFSPSERYLYGDENRKLYQWDLWADDIAASQTLVDTFDGFVQPGWFPMRFGPMILAPDGRIYVVPPAGSSEFMHVIDRPDEPAVDCRFLQHHINLTVPNGRSAPNIPNYRLGPLDGSPCDTLGLDNHPQSRWRFETEADDPLEIRFTDLSFFRPEEWYWDFGDGETSSTQHPIHEYSSPGLYYACLAVSNEYSADTSCQWIEIESVSTDDEEKPEKFIVHPNPFSDYIEVTPPERYRTLRITLIDVHGKIVVSPTLPCPCRLSLGNIPPGMYFYTLEEVDSASGRRKMVGSGRVVKVE